MSNLSLNFPSPRGYRRITPLGVSTLLWLNGCGGMSGQDKNTRGNENHDTPPAGGEQDDAPDLTGPEGADTRISKTTIDAAHAVNRYYTEQLMTRRSRTSGPQ